MKLLENLHPTVPLLYFLAVTFITMFTLNPVILALSYIGSIALCGMLCGLRELGKSLLYSLPVMLIIALTNPLFVHRGDTILFFMNDNPVTLEAILYGVAASAMLMSVFYWFKSFSYIMTGDKFVYLFGRMAPKLSLLLSMTLAFVPKFKRQYKETDDALKALGMYSGKGFTDRVKNKLCVMNALVGRSLENSVQTADSMRARGYGLRGRTSYAIFRWTARDVIYAAAILLFTAAICALSAMGGAAFDYYPRLSAVRTDVLSVALYAAMLILCALSALSEVKENVFWRYLKSKI